ncbi:MAG: hypothetical protein F4Z54_07450, partial [Acidimicrobiaceae bacterium]|nr:hypothetical protein [Acidimicrobiaceae bacterium]
MISRLSDDRSRATIAASIERRRVDTRGLLFRTLLQSCLLITLALLAVLLITVALDSTDQLGTRLWEFLQGTLRSRSEDERLGIHQGMYGSLWIAIIVA